MSSTLLVAIETGIAVLTGIEQDLDWKSNIIRSRCN